MISSALYAILDGVPSKEAAYQIRSSQGHRLEVSRAEKLSDDAFRLACYDGLFGVLIMAMGAEFAAGDADLKQTTSELLLLVAAIDGIAAAVCNVSNDNSTRCFSTLREEAVHSFPLVRRDCPTKNLISEASLYWLHLLDNRVPHPPSVIFTSQAGGRTAFSLQCAEHVLAKCLECLGVIGDVLTCGQFLEATASCTALFMGAVSSICEEPGVPVTAILPECVDTDSSTLSMQLLPPLCLNTDSTRRLPDDARLSSVHAAVRRAYWQGAAIMCFGLPLLIAAHFFDIGFHWDPSGAVAGGKMGLGRGSLVSSHSPLLTLETPNIASLCFLEDFMDSTYCADVFDGLRDVGGGDVVNGSTFGGVSPAISFYHLDISLPIQAVLTIVLSWGAILFRVSRGWFHKQAAEPEVIFSNCRHSAGPLSSLSDCAANARPLKAIRQEVADTACDAQLDMMGMAHLYQAFKEKRRAHSMGWLRLLLPHPKGAALVFGTRSLGDTIESFSAVVSEALWRELSRETVDLPIVYMLLYLTIALYRGHRHMIEAFLPLENELSVRVLPWLHRLGEGHGQSVYLSGLTAIRPCLHRLQGNLQCLRPTPPSSPR